MLYFKFQNFLWGVCPQTFLKVLHSLEKLPAPTQTTTQTLGDASLHLKKTKAHDQITMLFLLRFLLGNWGP